jgi:hypothetical protein
MRKLDSLSAFPQNITLKSYDLLKLLNTPPTFLCFFKSDADTGGKQSLWVAPKLTYEFKQIKILIVSSHFSFYEFFLFCEFK